MTIQPTSTLASLPRIVSHPTIPEPRHNLEINLNELRDGIETPEAACKRGAAELKLFRDRLSMLESTDLPNHLERKLRGWRQYIVDIEKKVRKSVSRGTNLAIDRIWAKAVSAQKKLSVAWGKIAYYHLVGLRGRYWDRYSKERSLSDALIASHLSVIEILRQCQGRLSSVQMWLFYGRVTQGPQQSRILVCNDAVSRHNCAWLAS